MQKSIRTSALLFDFLENSAPLCRPQAPQRRNLISAVRKCCQRFYRVDCTNLLSRRLLQNQSSLRNLSTESGGVPVAWRTLVPISPKLHSSPRLGQWDGAIPQKGRKAFLSGEVVGPAHKRFIHPNRSLQGGCVNQVSRN